MRTNTPPIPHPDIGTDRPLRRLTRWVTGLAGALLIALTAGQAVAARPDLLPAAAAFRLSAELSRDEITVRYDVAPGYYLYRDRFRFDVLPPQVRASSPLLPRGKVKEDEFFGRVEILRNRVVIRIPVALPAGTREVRLKVVSQGCADAGVCYTPQEDDLRLLQGAGATRPAAARDTPHESLLDELRGSPDAGDSKH
ncbi:MAG: hypothetical protein GC151_19370 [Betaproteobacteria bacterium]|nr:hypothetical protein [Betaproteobacteria bacterium]